ncbi:MAG: hypothetical protein RLZZ591_958 [Pseudomonadota bacterium]|jgi:hypothetical protein
MKTAVSPLIDPTQCPVCGKSNQCAMELAKATGQAQAPCWCTEATFSAELLSRVPEDLRGKACICPACAATSTA